MNDFFFVYLAIGPRYCDNVLDMFKYVPTGANVLIMTNLCSKFDISVDFNLHVVDIETLRSDRNRIQEPLVHTADETEYAIELRKLFLNKKPFPIGIYRHALVWLLQHNITKFVLIGASCRIWRYEDFIKKLSTITSHTNIIFGNPLGIDVNTLLINRLNGLDCLELVKSYGIDLSCLHNKSSFQNVMNDQSPVIEVTNFTSFEAWIIGYWFNNQQHLQLYYDLWNAMMEHALEHNLLPSNVEGTFYEYEHILDAVNAIFSKCFDTLIAPHNSIVLHDYTGEWAKSLLSNNG